MITGARIPGLRRRVISLSLRGAKAENRVMIRSGFLKKGKNVLRKRK
jgi:hypothetical protein